MTNAFMPRSRRRAMVPAIVLAYAGCTAAPESAPQPLTPSALLANVGAFDGKTVTVSGWLDFGFEKRHLFEFVPGAPSQSDDNRACVSVEIDSSVRPDAEQFTNSRVTVEGVFHADLANDRVFLGLCNASGIRVTSIAAATTH